VVPDIEGVESHVFHLYVVRTKKRDALVDYLNAHGVQCGIHYPVPIYALNAYKDLKLSGKDFPVTEKCAGEILSLPMFPELSAAQIDEVVQTVKNFYKEKGR